MKTIRSVTLYAAFVATVQPALAQPNETKLPIPVGVWVDQMKSCSVADSAWVFDGRKTGYVGFNRNLRPGSQHWGELTPFTSVRQVRNGYTEFRPDGFGEIGRMMVKLEGRERISLVLRAPDRDRITESEEKLKLCLITALSPHVQESVHRFAPSLASVHGGAAGNSQAAQAAAAWQVSSNRDGALLAYVEGPAAINVIGLRCQADGSVVMAASAPGQRMDRPLLVSFSEPERGGRIDATLAYDAETKLFRGTASSYLLGHISEAPTMLDVGLNGRPAGQISATGSARAIRTALASCLGLNSSSPSSATASPPPIPPLGIAAGFYVDEGTACTDPFGAFYYDGKKAGMIYSDGGSAPDPIGKVRRENGEYFLPNAAILVKVLGPTRVQLTIQDTGSPMRLCPTEQIPQSIRRLVR